MSWSSASLFTGTVSHLLNDIDQENGTKEAFKTLDAFRTTVKVTKIQHVKKRSSFQNVQKEVRQKLTRKAVTRPMTNITGAAGTSDYPLHMITFRILHMFGLWGRVKAPSHKKKSSQVQLNHPKTCGTICHGLTKKNI